MVETPRISAASLILYVKRGRLFPEPSPDWAVLRVSMVLRDRPKHSVSYLLLVAFFFDWLRADARSGNTFPIFLNKATRVAS